ncbi:hypothetical protein F2Q69_00013087 [Brassica cretica]|uniref:Uncharacterized protein n=1 Tax=Brassica cretica TaxID=69181 RepID=A0A8S9QYB2_BRACR|nr:hypothetical protein F2Q69_00013087 [Brassica cretica]
MRPVSIDGEVVVSIDTGLLMPFDIASVVSFDGVWSQHCVRPQTRAFFPQLVPAQLCILVVLPTMGVDRRSRVVSIDASLCSKKSSIVTSFSTSSIDVEVVPLDVEVVLSTDVEVVTLVDVDVVLSIDVEVVLSIDIEVVLSIDVEVVLSIDVEVVPSVDVEVMPSVDVEVMPSVDVKVVPSVDVEVLPSVDVEVVSSVPSSSTQLSSSDTCLRPSSFLNIPFSSTLSMSILILSVSPQVVSFFQRMNNVGMNSIQMNSTRMNSVTVNSVDRQRMNSVDRRGMSSVQMNSTLVNSTMVNSVV